MRLRQIELHGFKTFANQTNLELPPGVTAVVGPNGSGKSNVSDAVLWALGEQNVRNLRGGKLQDVIFAGSSTRRPTGFAEVALTFDNSSRRLPLDYGEITVARRVFRSGESEYFINRTGCRLKDVVDLFLDSGIGKDSYFALNQGEIDMILSADPDERRILFEEAAGIKKYRARKREGLRKLESTELNLSRIHDLMSEIESRIGPLERQAEKALRYLEIAENKRRAELGVFVAEWHGLSEQIRALGAELEAARAEQIACGLEFAQVVAREEAVRAELQALDERFEAAYRIQEAAVAKRSETEGRLRVLRERLDAHGTTSVRARERLTEIEQQRRELEGARKEAAATAAESTAALRAISAALSEHQESARAAEEQWRRASAAVQAAQRQAVEAAARRSRLAADKEAARDRLESFTVRQTELSSRIERASSQLRLEQERSTQLDAAEAEAKARIEALETESALVGDLAARMTAERKGLEESVRDAERELSGARSRLRLLEELHEQREGYYRGPREVLRAASDGRLAGHYRSAAEILTIAPEHEAAIEAALGSSLQDVVTHTDQEAEAGIALLKKSGAGRATFLSLQLIGDLQRGEAALSLHGEGIIGLGADLVAFEPVYRPVVRMLLGRTVVCDNLENGGRLARRLRGWSRIVTLEGEVISSQGALTGGSRGQVRTSLVSRSREIRELKSTVQEREAELQSLRSQAFSIEEPLREHQERLKALEIERQQARTAQAQRSRDRQHLLQERQRLERDAAVGQQELNQLLALEEAARERLASLESAPELDEQKALEPSVEQALEAAALQRDRVREALAELRADQAALQERARSANATLESIRARDDRLAAEEHSLRERMEADDRLSEGTRIEHEEAAAALDREQLACLRAAAAVDEVRSGRAFVLQKLEAVGGESRESMRRQQDADHHVVTLQSACGRLEGERDRIRGVLAEEYRVGRPEVSGAELESSDDLPPGEGEPNPEVEAAPLPSDDDVAGFLGGIPPSSRPTHDRQLANRLRREMRSLEPVNVDAIQEAREAAERLTFLRDQRSDVEAAAEDLIAVIRKMDIEARKLFLETFAAVAREFDDLFRRLFGGGQTRLGLLDPADPLQSGIEISAQPPGKRLQSLSLLSGGERSLTAVALLFAMLRVRPVPFCILDEVDAALDEANVTRFGEVLREFAAETQFIVITHNRATMEMADRLFGVTMTEPGVSRILTAQLTGAVAEPAMGG